jgi:hypothetical protein
MFLSAFHKVKAYQLSQHIGFLHFSKISFGRPKACVRASPVEVFDTKESRLIVSAFEPLYGD